MADVINLDDHRPPVVDQFCELYDELVESDDDMTLEAMIAIDLLRAALAQDGAAWKTALTT